MNAVNLGAARDAMLSDRLACEVNETVTQRRLLTESNLDLKWALEISLRKALTTKNSLASQRAGGHVLHQINQLCPSTEIQEMKSCKCWNKKKFLKERVRLYN